MGRTLSGKNIESVTVLDDDEASRKAVVATVADGDVTAVAMAGPLNDLVTTIDKIVSSTNALVSDHHLTTYADFDGASAVAEAYKRKFPAVLCSAWAKAKVDEIRKYRRWIPSIVDSSDATEPEAFFSGFDICLKEFAGHFSQSRKPWRVQLRVEEAKFDEPTPVVYVVLPGWSASVIKVLASDIPSSISEKIKAGTERFHVMANKGADEPDDLYFEWVLI